MKYPVIFVFLIKGECMKKLTDEAILKLLRRDKSQGIRCLFDKYYVSLVVFGEQIVKDRNQSEDLVQELFVRLWTHDYLDNVQATDLRSYLFRSIRNSSLTNLKKNDSLKETVDLLDIQLPEDNNFSTNDRKVELALREIEKLPERTRKAIQLVMLERKKYQEVADEMEISVNTVKYLLKEGTKKLRDRLRDSEMELFLLFFRK